MTPSPLLLEPVAEEGKRPTCKVCVLLYCRVLKAARWQTSSANAPRLPLQCAIKCKLESTNFES